ncbi:uncharacterized protein LOC115415665 [Sphaeramia orbicularis]|uniref:uncharacterized protein LOC115415665 n=1 Tax=Sphaeramia orbicularis TaxID=375764 RepID=UPI00117DBBB4|nr:uncharacterized protein LOC115415665 [Sphaeramia orbicularis]
MKYFDGSTLTVFVVLLSLSASTPSYVTELQVSLDQAEEQQLQATGFRKVNVDLNKGAGGKYIYLWYKKQSEGVPITRIQISFNSDMADGLARAGYTQVPKDLNAGSGGDFIYLWYFKGTTEYDTSIQDVDVTVDAEAEAQKFKLNWERVTCDLNRKAGGNWIHMWVKRQNQTYICDVTATDSYGSDADHFREGYIRMDEDTNRGAGGSFVFLWYRQTTDPSRALTSVDVSTNGLEYQQLQQRGFSSVSVNLNEGTSGGRVYLWYKKEESVNPIKTITLLANTGATEVFKRAGVNVIEKDLNSGNDGHREYLCFYQ